MKKAPNQKNISTKFYSMNEFLKDCKKLSSNETINTFNTINSLDDEFTKKDYQTPLNFKSEMRNELNEKLKFLNQAPGGYVNEVMKSELKILSKENAELKFCLNNLNKKYDKEIKELKLQNENKAKEIQSTKEVIKKNTALIELLGNKIMNYEKKFKEIESKNEKKIYFDKNIKNKLLDAEKENNELKKDLTERDEIIKSFKDEIDSKKEIFDEIDKMKNEMEEYLKTMDNLYKEIENKDKEINNLKQNMELMENKHKQELESISKNKSNNNPANNEDLSNELSKSKEKQIQLTKDLIDVKKSYDEAKNYSLKMQKITKEASDMIKKSIDARDKMKNEYDNAIKDLVDKYEKQIQFMKLVIVEQNEKFEKQLEDLKNEKKKDNKNNKDDKENKDNINNIDVKDKDNKDNINNKDNNDNQDSNNENDKDENDDIDNEEKKKYLEKLKNDNTMLIEQNLELKNMNELLLSKMKDLPDLNDKFNELFETVKLLKEENDLLKKSMKDNKIFKMLAKEEEEEEKEDEEDNNLKEIKTKNDKNKEKEKDENDNDKDNNEEEPKLSAEELELLENILYDVENNKGGDSESNQKKLAILENLLKKLENKNEEEENKEEDNKENNNEDDKENDDNDNEEEKNIEDLNFKKQLLLEEMLKNLGAGLNDNNEDNEENKSEENKNQEKKSEEDKSEENKVDNNKNIPLKINNVNNVNKNESIKDKNNNNISNKIYNKKHLKLSPKTNKNKNLINNISEKDDNEKKEKTEVENEEEENEEEEDENTPNQINENFNLYKPTKDGMLSFSLSKKNYSTVIPNKYEEFLKVFDPDTSVQYNTLEGLFIIPSNKCNQLFYYSSKKNTMNDLFLLNENHSGGCLFLDNISKNIIALGGYESKAVEKFGFESRELEQLPELPTHRSKITCNQIGNKIYCFFGNSKENPNKSVVDYLDLDNVEEGWVEIDFENQAEFDVIAGMSCINLNDNELLIIGGLINNNIPNEKLLYFNIETKKLMKLDKNLPDSEDKVYLFTQNTMFNLFVNGEIISFANIDNNNQVHILDNELCYDLYLTPKVK